MAIKEIHYKGRNFPIYYEITNLSNKHNFIVLHGWGSNKEIMKNTFAPVLSHFRHIYIDMPGFGKSPAEIALTTEDYKNIIALFLDTIDVKADIVAGHSFGGKVATLLQPKLLVLLSSAGIKTQKPLGIRFKIVLFKFFKKIGLGKFRTFFASKDVSGMSDAMYKTFKNVVDEDFSDIFAHYHGSTLLFWGKEDTATPLSSGKKIENLIQHSKLFPMEGDHFFFTKYAQKIGDIITEEFHG